MLEEKVKELTIQLGGGSAASQQIEKQSAEKMAGLMQQIEQLQRENEDS